MAKEIYGPLSKLESNTFQEYTLKKYPSEGLGDREGIPSYMMFYINLPEKSKYEVEKVSGVTSTSYQFKDITRQRNTATSDKVGIAYAGLSAIESALQGNILKGAFGSVGYGALAAGINEIAYNKIGLRPRTNRIVDAIQLYMPDTIMHRDQQDYDQISITNALGGLRLAQLAAGKFSGVDLEAIKDSDIKSIFNSVGSDALGAELTGRIGERFGITSPELTQALLQNQGVAMNPRLEMVFSKKDFRVFQFDFRFQPKSLAESKEIRDIITTFRRYSAPELSKEAGMVGQYYIVPAEFDIEYYSGNTQNEYIGKISSCVLESVDINYSQAGQFAIFDAEGGPPVQIGMTLTFREIDVITREMVDQGF